MTDTTPYDARLDRLVSTDIGGRGIAALHEAAMARAGGPPIGAAADLMMAVPEGGTVLVTTGSVSRAWLSPELGENDGPSGAAALVRALWVARRAACFVVVEETLAAPMAAVLRAGGVAVVDEAVTRQAAADGSMACCTVLAYPVTDDEGAAAAAPMLERIAPDLMVSTERVGRNANGIYYNMRGRDYGMGRARVDLLWDAGRAAGVPSVAVGDGGNEIGMGDVAEAVAASIPFGAPGDCPCGGGIGAVSGADVLVVAGVSNWGCTALCAALALRAGNARALHVASAEARLLEVMTAEGLINSADGLIDPHVDGIRDAAHVSIAHLAEAIVAKPLGLGPKDRP